MTIVTAQMSVSVDGFYAGPEHTGTQPWLEGAEAAGFFRVTRWVIDAEAWRQRLGFKGGEHSTNLTGHLRNVRVRRRLRHGAAHGGRRRDPLGRRAAIPGPGVRGHPPPQGDPACQGGTSFTYVTSGIEDAIGQARAAANGKNVAIAGGGTLLRQVIGLGLLDQLELHVVPVILGDGMRLLGPGLGLDDMEAIELTPARVIAAPDVTHIRYTVHGRRPLLLDDRGRDEQPATA